jgi:hypothetical protein
MTSYFLDVVRDLHTNTDVAVKALFEGESGTAEVRLVCMEGLVAV